METTKRENDNLINIIVDDSLTNIITELERMRSLYKVGRYTQAERLRDEISAKLDDVMRDVK